MKRLAAIAAIGRDGELGKDGDMPWGRSLSSDLKFFKSMTQGKPVIMGYRTWKSLPKALPGRLNMVITSHEIEDAGVLTFPSTETCLAALEKIESDAEKKTVDWKGHTISLPDAFVIGGGSIYHALLDACDQLFVTEIDASFDADTWFPGWNREDYDEEDLDQISENGFSYCHKLYTRKRRS